MPRTLLAIAFAFLACSSVRADASDALAGRLVQDTWETAYLNGTPAGYVRFTVRAVDVDGVKVLRSVKELSLTVRRFRDVAKLDASVGSEETPDGKVRGVSMKQSLGKQQVMELIGVVKGNELHVTVEGQRRFERKMRWDDGVIGMYQEQNLLRLRKPEPGDVFSYRIFEPTVNAVVSVSVSVGKEEEIEVEKLGKRRLLKVEAVPDEIGGVQLPSSTFWYDPMTMKAVRSVTEMPGLGKLVLVRAEGPVAVDAESLVDIGTTQSIKLNKRIPNPHRLGSIDYRVTLTGDKKPETAFATDGGRQEISDVDGQTFTLTVRAVRGPKPLPAGQVVAAPAAEFLKSNYFINSDDAKVKQLARQAIGDAVDPWDKARRIERWVHDNMKALNFTEAMATADQVAKTLEGDCTEYSMLAAAMCRAVGVPSRTAIGLVYAELTGGPVLAYHMWTEVWIAGHWLALDAVLGQGSVGPAHLKITDHSWHDTQALTPILPVMRVLLAKPKVDVLRAYREE